MKPAAFEYLAPKSLTEAKELMAQYGDEAKLLAGGQSLVPAMNFRLVQPTLIVDLNRVEELDFVREGDGGLIIGAMTRQRTLERHPLVRSLSPLLFESLPNIAHVQIRNRGTIGGSLAHADPAAELPVITVALEAEMHIEAQGSDRWVPAEKFFQGLFETELGPDEILTEIRIPAPQPMVGTSFVEFARRSGDYALLGVAASLRLGVDGTIIGARLVYLNAGDAPIIAESAAAQLLGQRPGQDLFRDVGLWASEHAIRPTGTIHASVPYLKQLAKVLTLRALTRASERAAS
jgi:CO/xanthine dehydrogenase FAD-binding subunit